jgi:hypothetical protein
MNTQYQKDFIHSIEKMPQYKKFLLTDQIKLSNLSSFHEQTTSYEIEFYHFLYSVQIFEKYFSFLESKYT